MPVLVAGAGAAVDYTRLSVRQSQLQRAADTGALTAARQLSLANTSAGEAQSVARTAAEGAALDGRQAGTTWTTTATVPTDRQSVSVEISETVPTILAQVLGVATGSLRAYAQARVVGKMKLCALVLDPQEQRAFTLDQRATLTAIDCSVYSNSKNAKGVSLRQFTLLIASGVYSAGGIEAKVGLNITGATVTDAPVVPDPLAGRQPPADRGCMPGPATISGETRSLSPGTYCGGLKVTGGATVTLSQGEYVFKDGPLLVDGGGTLKGDYVGLYFLGSAATMEFAPDSTISLSAPKIGAMAGLLIVEDKAAPVGRDFKISSNNARRLLGTIYLPQGSLYIDADRPIADLSAYTVVVARTMKLEAGPNLILNSNYGSTDVPVPQGVGPLGGSVVLAR